MSKFTSHPIRPRWRGFLTTLSLLIVVWSNSAYADDVYSPELGAWVRLVKWRDNGTRIPKLRASAAMPRKSTPWPSGYYAPALQVIFVDSNSKLRSNYNSADPKNRTKSALEEIQAASYKILPVRSGDILIFNKEFSFRSGVSANMLLKRGNDGSIWNFTEYKDFPFGLKTENKFGSQKVSNTEEALSALQKDAGRPEYLYFTIARPTEGNKAGGVMFEGVSEHGVRYEGYAELMLWPGSDYPDDQEFKINNPWYRINNQQAQQAQAQKSKTRGTLKFPNINFYDVIFGMVAITAAGAVTDAAAGCYYKIIDSYYASPERVDEGALNIEKAPSCDAGYMYNGNSACIKQIRECPSNK